MTRHEAIRRVDDIIARQGRLPASVRLTFYDSFADWHLPAEDGPATEADFRQARAATEAVAAELLRRGVIVLNIPFRRAQYDQWRDSRPDTRNLRADWASHVNPERAL